MGSRIRRSESTPSICRRLRNSNRGYELARNFRELEAKMTPESRARSDSKTKKMIAEMALDELREAREMTQQHLANLLGINQAAVSKMERRADMYISTLQSMIRAMGGQLKIEAVFPERKVEINQFRKLKKSAGAD